MFNKKTMVLLVFLLIILSTSFVSAMDYNETDINNKELSVNNNTCENDYITGSNDVLDFNQGDKIPVSIDSPVDGDLTVLTYNPDSFYDNTIKNINVGTHKLSLIFKLNTYNNYVPIVSNKDSNLTFKFNISNNTLNNKYTYTYTSTLNIHEKEKTIYFESFNPDNIPMYFSNCGINFYIRLFDVDVDELWYTDSKHPFGFSISDDKGIIIKYDIDIMEAYPLVIDYDKYGTPFIRGNVLENGHGISYDVVRKLGVCNLTVVNFEDGTQDSVLFNVSKFSKFHDVLDFEIIDSDFIVSFYNWKFPDVYITIKRTLL